MIYAFNVPAVTTICVCLCSAVVEQCAEVQLRPDAEVISAANGAGAVEAVLKSGRDGNEKIGCMWVADHAKRDFDHFESIATMSL